MTENQASAAATFCETFADAHLAADTACTLTCDELDALTGLLRSHGYNAAADIWDEIHAEGDDEGDRHHNH